MKAVILFILFPMLINAQSKFDVAIAETSRQLSCPPPSEREPVSVNAKLVAEGDSIAVVVKTMLAPGWHIYQYVPSTLPYIPIEHILEVPENIKKVGTWVKTKPMSSVNDPGVLIYEEEAIFVHKLVRISAGDDIIKTGLYYQTCNLKQCLPPVEKSFDLKLK